MNHSATGSPTATLLRLHPSHIDYPNILYFLFEKRI
jgi:hypothetical protein